MVKESSVFTVARPPTRGSAIFVSRSLQNLRELTERLFVLVDVVHQILLDDVCVKNILGTLLVLYCVAECFGRRLYY